MYFLDFLRVLGRQWGIVVPGFLLIVIVALGIAWKVGPEYKASGSVLFVAPNPPGVQSNPYLSANGSLNVVAAVLGQVMTQDDPTVQRMLQTGATAQYTVTPGVGPSPTLDVIATGKSPGQAIQTVQIVSRGIQDEVARRQKAAGAPASTWIRADVLTIPDRASLVFSRPLRALAAVAALGGIAVVALAFALEAADQRRRVPSGRTAEPPARLRAFELPADRGLDPSREVL